MDFSFYENYSQYIMGLGAVLILMGALTWGLQKLNFFGARPRRGNKGQDLRILSSLSLDPKRRLVAIEFNRRKHLLLLGQTSELLIESEDLTLPTYARETFPSREKDSPPLSDPGAAPPRFRRPSSEPSSSPLPQGLRR